MNSLVVSPVEIQAVRRQQAIQGDTQPRLTQAPESENRSKQGTRGTHRSAPVTTTYQQYSYTAHLPPAPTQMPVPPFFLSPCQRSCGACGACGGAVAVHVVHVVHSGACGAWRCMAVHAVHVVQLWRCMRSQAPRWQLALQYLATPHPTGARLDSTGAPLVSEHSGFQQPTPGREDALRRTISHSTSARAGSEVERPAANVTGVAGRRDGRGGGCTISVAWSRAMAAAWPTSTRSAIVRCSDARSSHGGWFRSLRVRTFNLVNSWVMSFGRGAPF